MYLANTDRHCWRFSALLEHCWLGSSEWWVFIP